MIAIQIIVTCLVLYGFVGLGYLWGRDNERARWKRLEEGRRRMRQAIGTISR